MCVNGEIVVFSLGGTGLQIPVHTSRVEVQFPQDCAFLFVQAHTVFRFYLTLTGLDK